MTEIEKRTGMTVAECEYWEKRIIEDTDVPGPNLLKLGYKPGHGNNIPLQLSELDREVIAYLYEQVKSAHKSCTQIINDIVLEKMAVCV
jgi:hypothetical protein